MEEKKEHTALLKKARSYLFRNIWQDRCVQIPLAFLVAVGSLTCSPQTVPYQILRWMTFTGSIVSITARLGHTSQYDRIRHQMDAIEEHLHLSVFYPDNRIRELARLMDEIT